MRSNARKSYGFGVVVEVDARDSGASDRLDGCSLLVLIDDYTTYAILRGDKKEGVIEEHAASVAFQTVAGSAHASVLRELARNTEVLAVRVVDMTRMGVVV